MTKEKGLFPRTRVCCCCKTEIKVWDPLNRAMMAISFTLYRRPQEGKSELKSCPAVQICKKCFEKLITEGYIYNVPESRNFLSAVRESLANRYSEMLERTGSR